MQQLERDPAPAVFTTTYASPAEMPLHNSPYPLANLGLDVFHGIRGLDLESDSLAVKGLHEDLHATGGWVNSETWCKSNEETYMKVGWNE